MRKTRVYVDGVELKLPPFLNDLKVVVELDGQENELANRNPHSLQVMTTFTPEGIITDLITDAYSTEDSEEGEGVIGEEWIDWASLVTRLEPYETRRKQ